jgi:dTDP-glucose 4,6-dehydratase
VKIVVTGGFGFIGSNFINIYWNHLLANGIQPMMYCLDSLTYAANIQNIDLDIRESSNFQHISCDITNSATVEKFIASQKFDSCIHFAAESHVDRSIEDPLIFAKTNFLGTGNLIDSWTRHQSSRFIHISTDEVYGSIPSGSSNEDAHLNPSSPYSASKAGSDLLVLSHVTTFGIDAVVTRCTNNYGPGQNSEKLLPKILEFIRQDLEIPVYGDGKYIREWIHVSDHVLAIIKILETKELIGRVYNIGSGFEITNLELIEIMARKVPHKRVRVKYVEDRLGHDRRYSLDSSRIRNELEWAPLVNFEEGIEKLTYFL